MENRNQSTNHIKGIINCAARKWFLGLLSIGLVALGGGILYAQKGSTAPPAPPSATAPPYPSEESPDPPEPPDIPDPSGPSGAAQFFFLNDGAVHLGVALDDVTAEKAHELKLPAVAGALVSSVQKDSAAAKAGIEPGDAIIEFDGVRVRSSAEMRRLIRETPAGRTVEMKIVRNGKTRTLAATLEASNRRHDYNVQVPGMPPSIDFPTISFPAEMHRVTLGISGDDLSPQLAQFFGVSQGKGVLVSEVTKGGAADRAGLKAGDVIVKVDGRAIGGVEELRSALSDNFTGDTRKVTLTIVRDHQQQTVQAELTRSQGWERRESDGHWPALSDELAGLPLPMRVEQLRAQAAQLHEWAQNQADSVRAKVLEQQKALQGEWQRQFREQMQVLRDQLKQLHEPPVATAHDKEI